MTVADYEGMRVSELMQPNERKWNEALIHQLFNLRDAAEILKIPISCMQDEDVPIWRFSKNGIYSVRSAYYQLMEAIIDNTHLRVEGDSMKIWRTLGGCLPVRLLQKGVQCEPNCPCCASATENECHCFIGCDVAQEVWREMGDRETMEQYVWNAQGHVELFFTLLQDLDSERMARNVMTLWMIWWRRNQKCWHDNLHSTSEVKQRATESLDDWLRVHCRQEHSSLNASRVVQQNWTKPQQGSFKCNMWMNLTEFGSS
ncbi:uncharacterized protein LOC123885984 [Trifolium pratense]|uniref:uncharacterized protein LOC123885984 n=1 Tax=Trifolium pratense TaxID=57577 RepID=UPI001E69418B|nr:uncharacterized protein LOC123885984 [Trifolium pratense]